MDKLRSLDVELLAETGRVSRDAVHHIARLLDEGANPNARDASPDNRSSALGNVVIRGFPGSVSLLIEHGACVHWPERSLPQRGAGGQAVSAVDALGLALNVLLDEMIDRGFRAQSVDENEENSDDHLVWERASIVRLLLKAGARVDDPDPATTLYPIQAMLTPLNDFAGAIGILPEDQALVVEIALDLVRRSDRKEEVEQALLQGQVSDLNQGWNQMSSMPGLTERMAAVLQNSALEIQTPVAPRNSSKTPSRL